MKAFMVLILVSYSLTLPLTNVSITAVSNAALLSLPNNTSPKASLFSEPDATRKPLSRGAAFMLVTTLAVAIAFHPFSGSLIYGPTSRFWILSPLSCFLDVLAVWVRLGEHIAWSLGVPWFYSTASGVSNCFTLQDAALAIVAARAMNAPSGARRRAFQAIMDAEGMQVIEPAIQDINEGFRFRLGVALPIAAQYVKIMAISGVFLPKLLGSLLIAHWATMEMLVLIARPLKGVRLTAPHVEEIVMRVEELLFLQKKQYHEVGTENDMHEHRLHQLHVWGFLVLSIPAAVVGCWPIDLLWMLSASIILPLRAIANVESKRHISRELQSRFATKIARAGRLLANGVFGGPNIGGDNGVLFFLGWILYCVMSYDSSGTVRPDWPWLDWLG